MQYRELRPIAPIIVGEPQLSKDGCWWIPVNLRPKRPLPFFRVFDFYATKTWDGPGIEVVARSAPKIPILSDTPSTGPILCGVQDGSYFVVYVDSANPYRRIGNITLDHQKALAP
jgi:hypothetical protein